MDDLKKKLLLIFGPTIASFFLFFFVIFIAVFIVLGIFKGDNTGSNNALSGGSSSDVSCSYNIDGKNLSNIKVRLLDCAGNTPVAGEELVDFEKYITGVVYQEVGSASYEALKTQAVAARSFALTRPKNMNGAYGISMKEENGVMILSLRSCTNDQVYCDPDKGCWSNRKGGQTDNNNKADWTNCTVHSGYDTSKTWTRGPLAEDSDIRRAVKETAGQVLIDSSGKIVTTDFTNSNQKRWESLASSGKDYFEILISEYGAGNKISTSSCTVNDAGGINTTIDSVEVAEIVKWDQTTAWKNIIGSSSNSRYPYVSKNTMDSRIVTIEVPMRKWKGSGSNPSVDTQKVMQKITVSKAIAPLWKAFFEDVYENATDFVIGSFDGCYYYRNSTGGGHLSAHAYGAACDINAGTSGNGYGDRSYSREKWQSLPETRAKYQVIYQGSKVVEIAHKYTLINGSDWSNPKDAMHFSYIVDWTRDKAIACQNKIYC